MNLLLIESTFRSAIYLSRAFRNQESEKRGPVMAYQFGNTIIVEGEDGEVIKTYGLPGSASAATSNSARQTHKELSWKVFGATNGSEKDDDNDKRIRFTIGGTGRRMTKDDFLREIQALDPKARAEPLDPQAESSKQAERRPEIQTSGLPEVTGPQEENDPLASARYYPETAIENRRRLAVLGVSAHSDTSDNDSQAPDRTGPWASGGLISPSETKEEGGLDISTNDASADAISGRSDAGQIDASNSSELSSKQSVPMVIITGTEDQTQTTWPNEGGEEAESDVSEPGKKPKDKGKNKVSFEL